MPKFPQIITIAGTGLTVTMVWYAVFEMGGVQKPDWKNWRNIKYCHYKQKKDD